MVSVLTSAQYSKLYTALYTSKTMPQIIVDVRHKEYTCVWTEDCIDEITGIVKGRLMTETLPYSGNLNELFSLCKEYKYVIVK